MSNIWRPRLDSVAAGIVVSIFLLATGNATFWHRAAMAFGGQTALYVFAAAGLAFFIAIFSGLFFPYFGKILAIFAIWATASAAYFTDTFGAIITSDMIENAVATTSAEGGQLITPAFLLHMLLFAVVPTIILLWTRIRYRSFFGQIGVNIFVIALFGTLGAGLVYAQFARISIAVRENKAMLETFNPSGPISSAIKFAELAIDGRKVVRKPVGTDARVGQWIRQDPRPVVMVFVVGETARAMNFSLNGYARKTNPELEKLDIMNFPNATSCGTDTAYSLPCMFTHFGKEEFSKRKARASQSLMDVVSHAGVDAFWFDNNTGSKGLADDVKYLSVNTENDPENCADKVCRDGVFLKHLKQVIDGAKTNTFVVLHQIGSHGPSYYLRYTDAERMFRPDCRTAQLPDCKIEDVVNAYDNTIVYTDHFLANVIGMLKENSGKVSSAMIYMSDHGESLGEDGLYLHGAPLAIAPKEQTHVPMIAWMSDDYKKRAQMDDNCLKSLSSGQYSHDNLYSTILGMMDISTSIYKPELDVFRSCRMVKQGS